MRAVIEISLERQNVLIMPLQRQGFPGDRNPKVACTNLSLKYKLFYYDCDFLNASALYLVQINKIAVTSSAQISLSTT